MSWHTQSPAEQDTIALVRTSNELLHVAVWDGVRDWHVRRPDGSLFGTLANVIDWTPLPGYVKLPGPQPETETG